MIRAVAILVVGIALLSGLVVGGQRLLAGEGRAENPVTLRRFDDGSKMLSYDLEGGQVLVFVVDDADSCHSFAIVGPGQNELMMGAGSSVTFSVTDPAGKERTRARLLDEEC